MDSVFEAYLGPDGVLAGAVVGAVAGATGEPDDIPKVNTTVWILGKSYNAIQELELIRRDVQSRLWCTYRRGFVPLGEPQLTTDKGWGCMLRCGQMVLAQALIDLHLGRDWYWTTETRDSTYLKIVNRFEDSRKSYFSIHQIALMGDSEDKKVGQWFGPNTVAQVLKKLVRYDDWCSLTIHVAMDNTIVIDDIISLCLTNPKNDESWKPLLLILPLRLGLSDINPIYIPALKKCFELVGNCGMIGGRPNQALYFLGYVDDEVLFLDPHTTQRSGGVGQKTTQDEIDFDETFHQKYAGRIQFTQMDPSLAVCFLCKSRMSFDILLENLKNQVLTASTQPLFEITKTRSPEWVSSMTGIMASTNTTYHYPSLVLNDSNNCLDTVTETVTDRDTTEHCYNSYEEVASDLNTSYITYTTTSSDDLISYSSARTISCGDTEDFENVNHSSVDAKRRTCCDDKEGSDDDFEFIS
ncbi:cysteine protease ATG4B isoform X1 [Lucilia cuprina]|uniref:cysteine protease ATG4B isoform X1 n=1 Tax=Lucilia cuprina TaxID=7375 RepID=UPI001F0613D7|nr:cysteine protease ATG4B isoform X1 [Lucilia cuprina]XP_046812458.1 cysteine protease ATG4B isoform X1 [Lucilia cuprina]